MNFCRLPVRDTDNMLQKYHPDFAKIATSAFQKCIFMVNKSKTGFTLLELILVLFIISLIFGLSTIFFTNTMPSNRLNTVAREISAAIRHARTVAIVKSERQTLTIDLDSRIYETEDGMSKKIPDDINIKIIDPLLGDVVKGKYSLSFYETGGIEGGTIVLSTKKKTVNVEPDPIVGSVIIR